MALSDTWQSVLMFVTTAAIALNIYVATVPEYRVAIPILGAISVIAVVAKEQLGAKKAQHATDAEAIRQ